MAFSFAVKPAFGLKASRPSQRASVRVQARNAPWYPGSTAPEYLDGTLPGDFGFDPLQLGADAGKLKWYQEAELQHGRWAMLGVAGVLVPEVLGPAAPIPGVAWYDAGKTEYWGSPNTLLAIQFFAFSWVEWRRLQEMQNPGSVSVDPVFSNNKVTPAGPGYPGFDPMGLAKGADLASRKVKEIKNGRLAMLAFAGFAAQAFTTGTTPLANLATHLADPWNTTVVANDLARL